MSTSFLKMFLWNSRMQFWQTCHFSLPEVQSFFVAHHPKWQKKSSIFFPNDYSGHLQGSSYRVAPKLLAKTLKCFRRKFEKTLEIFFSFLSSNYSSEGMEFTFDKWQIAHVFLQIDQRPYAQNPKSKTRQTISLAGHTCFVQKAPLANYNAVPRDLPEVFGRNL